MGNQPALTPACGRMTTWWAVSERSGPSMDPSTGVQEVAEGEPMPVSRSFEGGGMPTVAMIGGGQLARMTHQAAVALGQCLRVLVERPDDPAAQVSPEVV